MSIIGTIYLFSGSVLQAKLVYQTAHALHHPILHIRYAHAHHRTLVIGVRENVCPSTHTYMDTVGPFQNGKCITVGAHGRNHFLFPDSLSKSLLIKLQKML